jgi:hypothetical protein
VPRRYDTARPFWLRWGAESGPGVSCEQFSL